MKLEPNADGFTIDARDLGRLLELEPEEVRALMQDGEITTRFERGEGEDAGRFRLTFTHGGRRVRLVVAVDGEVLHQTRTTSTPPPR